MGLMEELKESTKASGKAEEQVELLGGREEPIVLGGEVPDLPTGGKEPQPEPQIKSDDPIVIAGKSYPSKEAALRAMEELEMARAEERGFIEGIKAAKPQEAEAVQKNWDELLAEKFEQAIFENPKAAARELVAEAVAQAKKEIMGELTQAEKIKAETSRQAAQKAELWNTFYTEHPDLSESQEVVEYLLQKNWAELKDMDTSKSLPKLAEIARKQLRISRQDAIPRRDMPAGPARMLGASQVQATKAPEQPQQEPVSFIGQINNLRRRGG